MTSTSTKPKKIKNKGGRPKQARTRITFLIDNEDLAERRATGRGWQTRLNEDICVIKRLRRNGDWDLIKEGLLF